MELKEKPQHLEHAGIESEHPGVLGMAEKKKEEVDLGIIRDGIERESIEDQLKSGSRNPEGTVSTEALHDVGLTPSDVANLTREEREKTILNAIVNIEIKKDSPEAGTEASEMQESLFRLNNTNHPSE